MQVLEMVVDSRNGDYGVGDSIFNIPEANYKKFEAAIAKLSKKAEKLTGEGIEPVVFSYHMKDIGKGQQIKVYEVLLGHASPKLNGWEFIARVDHANKELGNIVRAIPGKATEVPEKYRNTGCLCEHCNVNRFRRDTFIVKHEDGTVKQVGRTCLKDFLGHESSEKIAKMAELLGYAAEAGRGFQNYQGDDRRYLNLETFLAHVAVVSRHVGYVPRSKAEELGKTATADLALTNLFDQGTYHKHYTVEDADITLAQEAIEWAQNLGEDGAELNEYQHNIKVLSSAGVIEFRSIGYAASIVGTFAREKQRALHANQLPTAKYVSQYVGKEKDKIEFEGTLIKQSSYETANGAGVRIAFKDKIGNDFVWFTGNGFDIDDGAAVKVTGTVKTHNEFKGHKQTILTRCKVKAV